MPEEAPLAPALQDTPQPTETPVEGTSTEAPAVDWEKRYNDLRPHADRTSQEAAEYRQKVEAYEALYSEDPDAQRNAAEYLGLELPAEEPQEYDDPFQSFEQKLASLEAKLAAKDQAEQVSQQEAALLDNVEEQFSTLESKEKIQLSDDDIEVVTALAMQMPGDNGAPNIEAAYKRLLGYTAEKATSLAAAKRASQAPSGEFRDKEYDFRDPKQRHEATVSAVERHMASR
jgi:hypothetical protein